MRRKIRGMNYMSDSKRDESDHEFKSAELITIGHILLDIRGRVDDFPRPDDFT